MVLWFCLKQPILVSFDQYCSHPCFISLLESHQREIEHLVTFRGHKSSQNDCMPRYLQHIPYIHACAAKGCPRSVDRNTKGKDCNAACACVTASAGRTAAAAKEKEACEKKQKRSHPFSLHLFFKGKGRLHQKLHNCGLNSKPLRP